MEPLLVRARSGENDARTRLHTMYARELERYVRGQMGRRLRRFTSIEEVCQETFLRVFRALESLPDDADFKTFRGRLFQNARWLVQQAAVRSQDFAGESATSRSAASIPSEEQTHHGDVQDQLRWLEKLISLLRPAYAEVIRLRLSGLQFREIAERLDAKEDTVRRRYSRAHRALEDLLAQRRGGEPR